MINIRIQLTIQMSMSFNQRQQQQQQQKTHWLEKIQSLFHRFRIVRSQVSFKSKITRLIIIKTILCYLSVRPIVLVGEKIDLLDDKKNDFFLWFKAILVQRLCFYWIVRMQHRLFLNKKNQCQIRSNQQQHLFNANHFERIHLHPPHQLRPHRR